MRILHTAGITFGFWLLAGCSVQNDEREPALGSRPEALASSDTVVIAASKDTSVSSQQPNKNFGASAVLDVNRTLIAFDAVALRAAVGQGDVVVSAQVELTLTNNRLRKLPRRVSVFRLTRDWTEQGATWNCPNDTNLANARPDCDRPWSMGVLPPNPWADPATTIVSVKAKTTGAITFDVTADVLEFVKGGADNLGWMLLGSTPSEFAEFASRETSTPPRLLLEVRRCNAALCDDGNACTIDSCDSSASCQHSPVADGTACDDGNACTSQDVCSAGACVGPSVASGSSCGADRVCDEAAICQYRPRIVINEAESSGGSPGDWVELYNAGAAPVDVSGYRFLDNDDTHVAYVIPQGTVVAPGGYLVLDEAAFGFGLGGADSVRLFDANGVLVDSYSWSAHAATTYGRCPSGSGAFSTTTSVTKGAANDCSVAVKVNEIESSGGNPGDWVELFNAGPNSADLSGFVLKDNDDTHAYVLPAGTTLAPGAYLTLEEGAFGFGLGAADSVRLFDATGSLVDTYSWTAHASTTYGRCPNGTGAFTTTGSVTKGAANECGSVGPSTAAPWPGTDAITTQDGNNVFGGNLSGLFYEAPRSGTPAVLWAVQNSPSTLYRLVSDGTIWAPEAANGWGAGKTLRYPDGTGSPDSEGVVLLGAPSIAAYVASERDNDAGGVSRLSILRFDPTQTGSELVATHEWNLTADLPVVGSNLGLEAVTFVPDTFLVQNGFFDERSGHTYNPADYADHEGGLFLVGLESNGIVYAYALDHVSGAFYRVATIQSGNAAIMDLAFDSEVGYLWAQCDDTCGNVAGVLSIDTTAGSPTLGRFVVRKQFARPSTLENLNNEGIAFASEGECQNGQKSFFWSDDSATGGHSLRRGSIPCGRFVP